ncbi:hypothetical protein DU803_05580 [Salmonella enterica subsp. enterica serovar Kapemba]|nr:hypothetical protein [Salmonella enterica subsp. enterica serovar Kapemba]EBY2145076.1 hypothetical protein [Salmonella enterica subsp. enterica serovar Kapemba]ECB4153136.1 hypothetical protein [Salmonella enterica subsp. enterica serovar Kapemba]
MIYLLVDQVAVQQPDEYRRSTLVTLIKSATTKKHSVKSARFTGILPTSTSDERYSAGCNAIEGFDPLWPNTIEVILNALCHIQSLLSQSIPGAGITASLFKN